MIQSRFDQLRLNKGALEGRKISLRVVAEETGIGLSTLHKLSSGKWTGIFRNTVDVLCKYFACGVGDLLEYVEDEAEQAEAGAST